MKSITQYRVCFLSHANVNDSVQLVKSSTQWFDSKELAESSRWMKEEGAHLVSRIYTSPAKVQQIGMGYWRVLGGKFAGMFLSRKEVGTDTDGSGIYTDVKLTPSHPMHNEPALQTFPTLYAAIESL